MKKDTGGLILQLGGVPISIRSQSQKIVKLVKKFFKGFIVTKAIPAVCINVTFDQQMKSQPYIYGNPHRASVLNEGGKMFIKGSVYRAVFDPKENKGDIRQGLSIAPIYLFLRAVMSAYLPTAEGFLMHSTSVAKNGKAYLFFGPPGSGKSTVAALSSGCRVLSDDFSILRKVNGRFCCFASPFCGHVEVRGANVAGKEKCIPIKGLYFLKKDDEVYVRKLDKKEAVRKLIANTCIIAKDGEINKNILRIADELTETAPVNTIHFKKDDSFWRCVEND